MESQLPIHYASQVTASMNLKLEMVFTLFLSFTSTIKVLYDPSACPCLHDSILSVHLLKPPTFHSTFLITHLMSHCVVHFAFSPAGPALMTGLLPYHDISPLELPLCKWWCFELRHPQISHIYTYLLLL